MRVKRLLTKALIVVCGCGATIAAFGTPLVFWFQLDRDRIASVADSSDSLFRASVVEERRNDGQLVGTTVLIERKFWIIRMGSYTPFILNETADHVSLEWTGKNEVTISCHACSPGEYEFYAPKWGRVVFRYDLALSPRTENAD